MRAAVRPVLGAALMAVLALGLASPALAATTPAPSAPGATAPAGPSSGAPTPAAAPSGAPTPSASAGAAAPGPVPSASAGATHPVSVGGVLFVGGVRTTLHRSWNPLGGSLHVELTVRNATTQVVDASASIGAATLVGVDLGNGDSIAVRGLNPGEIRTISTDIGGIGQWGVLRAHVTVTPPAAVGGVALQPLTRDRWLLVPPWYLIGLVVVVVAGVWVLRHYRLVPARRGPRHGGVPQPVLGPRPVVTP